MPATIATWVTTKAVAALGAAGLSGTGLSAAAIGVYAGTYAAVTLGAAYASQSLLTDTPDSGSAQGSMRQPIPPRIEAYGYGRLPGQFLLWEAKENYAYDVVAFHHGEAESIDEIWSHDHKLTIGGGGWVTGTAEYGGGNNDLIHIETRLGLATETAYSAIVAALGGAGVWTSDHRGDGLATLGADYHHAKKENLLDDFPNGDPSWSAVGNWKLILDPRDDSVSASRNLAVQIMDLLISPTGFGQDYEATIEPILDHWIGEMDICDEAIPQKAGGTAPRYEGFAYRALSEDPAECLNKLLAACDGKLLTDENGCYKLWVGKTREPTVFLTEEDIHGYEVAGDADPEDVVNEILPRFKSPDHKWNMVETDAWLGDEVGGETQTMDLEAVTNNSQARRLAKRAMARTATEIRGRLDCKLSATRAMGERWLGVDLPELGLADAVIEVEDGAKTSLSSLSVPIPFSKADMNADEWNAATEEGDGPAVTDRVVREALDTPTISDVTPFYEETGSGSGIRLTIEGDGPLREDLTWFARWRVDGDASWAEAQYTDSAAGSPVLLETSFVPADADLEVQIAYQTGGGTLSPWSTTFDVATESRAVAPTGLAVVLRSDATGYDLGWSNGAGATHAVVYRGAAASAFGSAVNLSGDVAASGGTAQTYSDTTGIGAARYWVTNKNAAGESNPAGPFDIAAYYATGGNLLSAAEDFSSASWTKAAVTVSANSTTAPDGTTTADTLTSSGANGYAAQAFTAAAATNYRFGVWVKAPASGVTLSLNLTYGNLGGVIAAQSFITTGAWQRVTVTGNTAALSGAFHAVVGGGSSFSTGETLYAWGAQVRAV